MRPLLPSTSGCGWMAAGAGLSSWPRLMRVALAQNTNESAKVIKE